MSIRAVMDLVPLMSSLFFAKNKFVKDSMAVSGCIQMVITSASTGRHYRFPDSEPSSKETSPAIAISVFRGKLQETILILFIKKEK